MKPQIHIRGSWTPTQAELDRLREFKHPALSGTGKRRKVFFVPGREPFVSFILAGREPLQSLVAGTRYFVELRVDPMADLQRLRRVIRVYPEGSKKLPPDLHKFRLDYMIRPLTVFECWRGIREELALERTYPNGEVDRIVTLGRDRAIAECACEDDFGYGVPEDDVFKLKIQRGFDLADEEAGVPRPDWRLTKPLDESSRFVRARRGNRKEKR